MKETSQKNDKFSVKFCIRQPFFIAEIEKLYIKFKNVNSSCM